ncbi:facilitated trehalose transporter Tret1-like isoform X2 [Ornithodoros turicata]|uniref:facilitated trehalose transporter Tret1-like isoform X2 n=1 Tax=Ornithodoros turicata TaxID=34597 RepID=UPI0031396F56
MLLMHRTNFYTLAVSDVTRVLKDLVVPLTELPESPSAAKHRLYLTVGVLYLSSLAFGNACAYSSPALCDIRQRISFTAEDTDWFGTLLNIGAVFGGLAAGGLINLIGRKRTVLLASCFFVGGWGFTMVAESPSMLFVGRFIVGFAVGLVALALPVFISEISPSNTRGVLCASSAIVITLGIMLTFILGKYLNYILLSLACMLPSIVCGIGICFIHESPRWLYQKGRKDQVVEALHFYVGPYIENEMYILRDSLDATEAFTLADIPYVCKPFFCTLLSLFLQQFSGICILLYFTHDIFESSGSTISAADCSIIVSAVQFLAIGFSSPLADRLGRKILLLASVALAALSHVTLGLFFYFKNKQGNALLESFGWVPLVSVSVYFFGYAIGLAGLPWVLLGEMLPSRVKGAATGFCTAFCFACGVVVVKTFPDMLRFLGDAGLYWFYATVLACGFVLCISFVPETKGKSLEEIEELFGRKTSTEAGSKPNFEVNLSVLPV